MSMKEPRPCGLLDAMVLCNRDRFGLCVVAIARLHGAGAHNHGRQALEYAPDNVDSWAQYSIPFLVILSPGIAVLQLIHFRRRFQGFWKKRALSERADLSCFSRAASRPDSTSTWQVLVDGQEGLAPRPSVICGLSWLSFLDMSPRGRHRDRGNVVVYAGDRPGNLLVFKGGSITRKGTGLGLEPHRTPAEAGIRTRRCGGCCAGHAGKVCTRMPIQAVSSAEASIQQASGLVPWSKTDHAKAADAGPVLCSNV